MSLPSNGIRVAVVAPSGCAGKVEIGLGTERLKQAGFTVKVHPQSFLKERYLAGSDEARAAAFLEVAQDPNVDVVWCVRGGYGAIRTMERLDELLEKPGAGKPSPKILVGYSDVTALLDYVRVRWGWTAVHGSMLGVAEAVQIPEAKWSVLMRLVESLKQKAKPELAYAGLKVVTPGQTSAPIAGQLLGGNLSVLVSMIGTPYQPKFDGSILFLEEIDESQYRIDRLLTQLRQAGGFKGVKAIITGTYTRCRDLTFPVLSAPPKKVIFGSPLSDKLPRKPLRKVAGDSAGVEALYRELGAMLGIPVVMGLPVGHGGGYGPLVIGGRYVLEVRDGMPSAKLELVSISS